MRGNRFRLSRLLVLLATGLTLISPALAHGAKKNILILNSYHAGYKWSDETYQGLLAGIGSHLSETALHVEYLDMKRQYSEERFGRLAASLAMKYQNIPIDLLVSMDDAAFLFLKRYHRDLFGDTPVLFCGTNYLELPDLEGLPQFRGVAEKADLDATFALILRLLPQTTEIVVINDTTVTGSQVDLQLRQVSADFADRVDFTILDDISMPDLLTRVSSLRPGTVLFYTFFFRDRAGQVFDYDQAMHLIARQSSVPIFGAWDFNLGLGLVGGKLTSGAAQGQALGTLVRTWLEGRPFAELPKLISSPNRFMFDYRKLSQFGLSVSQLPADSIIINRPLSFVAKHRQVLVISGGFIAMLLLVILFLATNIRRRQRVERELRKSEENYRSLFDNAGDGMYQATSDGTFLTVNQALATLLKCETPEAAVAYYTDLDHQLYTSAHERRAFLDRLYEAGWTTAEHKLVRRDGVTIEVLESAHAVTAEDGSFLYYEGSITDLTEYKQTQELIAQTEKMMSLGGVAAGIAHEIRSPLTSITQGTQVVLGRLIELQPANLAAAEECGVAFARIQNYAKSRELESILLGILESGQRAGTIIEDMLSFSRQTIGDFAMEDLEPIIRSAITLAEKDYTLVSECRFKAITIDLEFPAEGATAYCSRSKIRQVCFNILKNAAEAMAEAGTREPKITIRLDVENPWVRLTISDNGPGMELDLQRRIFEPFYTTKGRNKGTGLGLSVSYFIITENHHGNFRVESLPGAGATFVIELPTGPQAGSRSHTAT